LRIFECERIKSNGKNVNNNFTLFKEEEVLSETFPEMMAVLEELRKEGKYVDVQIYPKCKSP
jgi:hypothetical protein